MCVGLTVFLPVSSSTVFFVAERHLISQGFDCFRSAFIAPGSLYCNHCLPSIAFMHKQQLLRVRETF